MAALIHDMRRHVRVLAFLFLVFGAFWALLALWFLSAGGVWNWDPMEFAFVFWFTLAAIPLLIAGWGLLRLKRWGRVVAIVLAAIALLLVPIGTAFGLYALWVLCSASTKMVFSAEP